MRTHNLTIPDVQRLAALAGFMRTHNLTVPDVERLAVPIGPLEATDAETGEMDEPPTPRE